MVHRICQLDLPADHRVLIGTAAREVDTLHFAPCFPADWTEFQVHYRFQETVYHIKITKSADQYGEKKMTFVDGVACMMAMPLS